MYFNKSNRLPRLKKIGLIWGVYFSVAIGCQAPTTLDQTDNSNEEEVPSENASTSPGSSAVSTAAASQLNIIEGIIIDDVGLPVAGADVYVLGKDGQSVETDEAGSFQLIVPESSNLVLNAAESDESLSKPETVSIITIKKVGGMSIGARRDGVDPDGESLGKITASPTGKIAGSVRLQGYVDYAGIDVYIPGTSFIAKTDSKGAYTISHVPAGLWEIRADTSGFESGEIDRISVTSDKTTEVRELVLFLSAGVNGRVIINGGEETSDEKTVLLSFEYTRKAVQMMISETVTFLGASWEEVVSGECELTISLLQSALTSVSISQTILSVEPGASIQLNATANYADGTSQDVTNATEGVWTNTNGSTLISTADKGKYNADITFISSEVTFTYNGKTDSVSVTKAALLQSITITPGDMFPLIAAPHDEMQSPKCRPIPYSFTATGTYDDQTTANITDIAIWTSSNTAVGHFDTGPGQFTCPTSGWANIQASLNGVSSNTVGINVM